MKIGFDKVYCISYCRNIEKQNNISKLMKYLGIDFKFIYGADYTNLKILKHDDFKFLNESKEKEKKNNDFKYYSHYIGASYDHYTAVIHAYESRANSVLIMEDDCTFINDTSYIQWALNNYPKDADIVKFGYIYTLKLREIYNFNCNKTKNKYILDEGLYFAGCQLYGLCNREIMKKYIDVQQNNFYMCDSMFIISKKCYGIISPLALDDKSLYIDEEKKYYTLLENLNKY